jgi:hypothetical protein
VFSKIQTQLSSYGFAAVMMHPMEFSEWNETEYTGVTNQTAMQDLVSLLNRCKAAGLKFVLLDEINTFFQPRSDPCALVEKKPSFLIVI